MTDTKDLVAQLRKDAVNGGYPTIVPMMREAADALEAQASRIAELEALAQGRLEQMEADRKQALVWRDRVTELEAEQLQHSTLIDSLKGDVQELDVRCDALKAELAAMRGQKPVAYCNDKVLRGDIGDCASAAAIKYWSNGDWVDKRRVEDMKRPLYAAPGAKPAAKVYDPLPRGKV